MRNFLNLPRLGKMQTSKDIMTATPSRAETAYQALRQSIIEQALPPGTRLPEDVIGGQFGMSRTLARATLARLQIEGLIKAGGKRTATVARPSLEEAKEDFEVRRALEREVIRLVIVRWKPEFGAILEGHVRKEDQARAGGDARVSIRLAGEFHIRLAEMSGNRLLQRYLSEVVSRCSLILALYGRPHSSECAINEHREIIDALRRGDAKAAAKLMDDHIGSVEGRALIEKPEFDLGAVLSRYAAGLEIADGTMPLPPRKNRASR
jgi:DNA-binding GntR family transcriptional regulator